MILKYRGPHRGGLQQVGTVPMRISWGTATEIPDELAELLLEQAPEHWEAAAKPKKSTSKKTAAEPADAQEANES